MISGLLSIYILTLSTLFPVVNPVSTTMVYIGLTSWRTPKEEKRKIIIWAPIYAFVILATFLLLGTFIIDFFGITLEGIRIAGGILLFHIAAKMLYSDEEEESDDIVKKTKKGETIAFSPIAMPMMSGPTGIAAVISLSSLTNEHVEYIAIIAGIVTMMIISMIFLRFSDFVEDKITPHLMSGINKIMGFLLLAISVQFVISGVMPLIETSIAAQL